MLPVLVIDFTNQTDLVEHDSNNNVLLVFLIGTRVLDALRPCYLLFWLVQVPARKIKGVVKKSQEICFVQYNIVLGNGYKESLFAYCRKYIQKQTVVCSSLRMRQGVYTSRSKVKDPGRPPQLSRSWFDFVVYVDGRR